MPRSSVLFRFKKKKTRRFKSYHGDWFHALTTKLLPRLTRSLSSAATADSASLDDLSSHVSALLRHFQIYYAALDRAAATPDHVPFLLNPPWRGSMEKPFLFLGDLHPYLFTNLLRSFLDGVDDGDGDSLDDCEIGYNLDFNKDGRFLEKQWQITTAWKSPNGALKPRLEEIERGLRLMIPALLGRMRAAQMGFVGRVAAHWPDNDCGSDPAAVVGEAAAAEMEEMARLFKDVNRLRQSTVSEIVGALTVYEAAQYLQALAQFVIGLGNSDPAHGPRK